MDDHTFLAVLRAIPLVALADVDPKYCATLPTSAILPGITLPNPKDRPSQRWLSYQRARGIFPYVKIGRLRWSDPDEVRQAIAQHCIVHAKSSALKPIPRQLGPKTATTAN